MLLINNQERPAGLVYHNTAPEEVALRLYGISKWSNENDIDLAIHVHFNDHPGRRAGQPGRHHGFAVYLPEEVYGNSAAARAVSDYLFKRLAKYSLVSDLPGESSGLVSEPDLIAIGADNTSAAPSLLIEYGYIYEPQFQSAETRNLVLRDLAYQTYLGLEDFFNQRTEIDFLKEPGTSILPYGFTAPFGPAGYRAADVLALQTVLISEGFYPSPGKNLNDCPRTSRFGPCTKAALELFQQKFGLLGEAAVGRGTLERLNDLSAGR